MFTKNIIDPITKKTVLHFLKNRKKHTEKNGCYLHKF